MKKVTERFVHSAAQIAQGTHPADYHVITDDRLPAVCGEQHPYRSETQCRRDGKNHLSPHLGIAGTLPGRRSWIEWEVAE